MYFAYISVVNWAEFVPGLLASISLSEITTVLPNALSGGVITFVLSVSDVIGKLTDISAKHAGAIASMLYHLESKLSLPGEK